MKHIKRIAAAVLALCALLALTACGGLQEKVESKLWETAAPILVQGNMDLLYKGVCDENYLKLVNSTQEDCLPYYEENMALQAQAIMAAFEINDVNNNQSDRFIDIMKQVYAKADYTIGNVDGPMGGKGSRGYKFYPQFNTPPHLMYALKSSGVDMLTLANGQTLTGENGAPRGE